MLEVLISLFVIMTSVLGYISVQVSSQQAVTASQIRTQAIVIGASIADGLRSNQPAAIAGDYDGAIATAEGGNCEGSGAECDRSDMVDYDRTKWQSALSTIPGGQARIQSTAGPGATTSLRVSVCWNESREPSTANCPPLEGDANPLKNFELEVLL